MNRINLTCNLIKALIMQIIINSVIIRKDDHSKLCFIHDYNVLINFLRIQMNLHSPYEPLNYYYHNMIILIVLIIQMNYSAIILECQINCLILILESQGLGFDIKLINLIDDHHNFIDHIKLNIDYGKISLRNNYCNCSNSLKYYSRSSLSMKLLETLLL